MDFQNALIEVVYCHIVIKCPLVLDPLSLIQIPFVLAALWNEAAISDNAGNQRCWRHIKGWVPWQVMLAVTHPSRGRGMHLWQNSQIFDRAKHPNTNPRGSHSVADTLHFQWAKLFIGPLLRNPSPDWLMFGLSLVGFCWDPHQTTRSNWIRIIRVGRTHFGPCKDHVTNHQPPGIVSPTCKDRGAPRWGSPSRASSWPQLTSRSSIGSDTTGSLDSKTNVSI